MISFDISQIKTDNSYMGISQQIDDFYSTNLNFLPYQITDANLIFELTFIINQIKTYYSRGYKKLQDVIVNINSILGVLFCFFFELEML